ncbi:MAG TPA: AsmA family protein [Blastocatellia bacterium]|nr:AsmA family protein [Blastocatellia bacterium]
MARPLRWLSRLLLFVVILVVAAILLAPLIPLEPLKPPVEARLSRMLGREVRVASLRLNVLGGPYLTINGMTAKEDPAFGEGEFLKADEVRADFALTQYLVNRQVVIDGITIKSPQFTFIKNANGAWSWTTLGQRATTSARFDYSSAIQSSQTLFRAARLFAEGESGATFKNIQVENGSVKLIDKSGSQPETLYKNIALRASVAPAPDAPATTSHVTGEVDAKSEAEDGAEFLKALMPFDLKIDRSAAAVLTVKGTVGPGPLETKSFTAGRFELAGQINSDQTPSAITGSGQISTSEMFIPGVNLSEQVAGALRIAQVGDMNKGTVLGSLETDFQLGDNVVNTQNLRIQQLDGLGDATANQGWFKIESALTLNYVATVVLSPDATSEVKKSSPIIGFVATILENNNRVSVPVNITGDARNPQVQVDVSRIF